MTRAPARLAARRLLWTLLAALLLPAAAAAQEAKPLGIFHDWYAYEATENGNKFCFMVSRPSKLEPANLNHGEVILYVTHRPSENATDVVSLMTGYNFKNDSEVRVRIGNRDFALFTSDNTAWARDRSTDRALVDAMRGGATLTARGTSRRGNATTYTFSLAGFSAAHDEISRACGVTS